MRRKETNVEQIQNSFRDEYMMSIRPKHKVNCSKCGKETEVPFKPIKGKPVFCRECYQR
ncbi:hypothetical protein JW968_03650 [Candidatus Woesearchaeota archaeon]|nr:hypothetical protein [Candidatus Woesearchaeota archaeon]